MRYGLVAATACLLLLGCVTAPATDKPVLLLLPAYVSSQGPNAPASAQKFVEAAEQAIVASGRYAVRHKGFFESGFDQALANLSYPRTAVLDAGERTAVAAALSASLVGLTDFIADPDVHSWHVYFRIVDASSGQVLEFFSSVVPWDQGASGIDSWRDSLATASPPQTPEAEPWLDRSGDWTSWWSLAPPLPPEAERWKDDLLAARFAGQHQEAARLADLLLERVAFGVPLSSLSAQQRRVLTRGDSWVAGEGAWLRKFLAREAKADQEARDFRTLMEALASPSGNPGEEEVARYRFLGLLRTVAASSSAGSRTEVLAAFRKRFGLELTEALSRLPLALVDGGTFTMGSETGEADEKPVRKVTVGRFLMALTEVTQDEYSRITATNPSLFTQGSKASQRPVERVTWFDAVEFCNLLSTREGLVPVYTIKNRNPAAGYPIKGADVTTDRTKNGYRLPTEAEWEWAARGGVLARGTPLAGGDDPATVAWTDGATSGPQAVATKRPNELGIYDLSGNVWEWCSDWYGKYQSAPQTDPLGPSEGIMKVGRGGSWHAAAWNARVTSRSYDNPGSRGGNIGFRVVRSLTPSAN